MTLAAFLERLRGVTPTAEGCLAFCPAHDDGRGRGLSVSAREGKILVHCFAGCTARAIVEAVGLRLGDLFADEGPARPRFFRPVSEQERALADVLRDERRRQARRELVADANLDADLIRLGHRTAAEIRAYATARGPVDAVWDLLAEAADMEREARRLDS